MMFFKNLTKKYVVSISMYKNTDKIQKKLFSIVRVSKSVSFDSKVHIAFTYLHKNGVLCETIIVVDKLIYM